MTTGYAASKAVAERLVVADDKVARGDVDDDLSLVASDVDADANAPLLPVCFL